MKIYKNTVRSNPGCVLFLSYPSFARYVPTAITASAAIKITVDISDEMHALELKLGHILYHLKESKSNFKGLLKGESGDIFLNYFKTHLNNLFRIYIVRFNNTLPADYLLCQLTACFAETAKWWLTEENSYSPEQMATYFMAFIGKSSV